MDEDDEDSDYEDSDDEGDDDDEEEILPERTVSPLITHALGLPPPDSLH